MTVSAFRTLGGVTPLKKGEKGAGSGKSITRKQYAGDVGRKATATSAQDRSGYSRSGGDYINVHSFTANTRVSPSLANTLGPSLKSAVGGKSDKKDKKDTNNDNVIGTDAGGNPIFAPDGWTVNTKVIKGSANLPKFEERWTEISDPGHDKYSTYKKYIDAYPGDEDAAYEAWVKDAKEWNRKNPPSSGPDKYVTEVKDNDGNVIHTYENEGGFDATDKYEVKKEE